MELVKVIFSVREFISNHSMFITYITTHIIMLSMGYLMIISPIIFNYFLIPGIEKRLGKKLRYSILYKYVFLSRWMIPQNEIAFCIARMFFKYKFSGISKLPLHQNAYALQNAGYTIKDATKIEIFLSFFLVFNILLIIICFLLALLVNEKLNIFLSN